jgi:hypothetical protein
MAERSGTVHNNVASVGLGLYFSNLLGSAVQNIWAQALKSFLVGDR